MRMKFWRRTDKLGQSESYGNIDAEYYQRAISMYRLKSKTLYWKHSVKRQFTFTTQHNIYLKPRRELSRRDFKSPKRVIFIAATDDKEWLKEAFAVETEDFWSDDIYFSTDLFSSVGIKAPGAGEDLALLSLCNHSIISVSWQFPH